MYMSFVNISATCGCTSELPFGTRTENYFKPFEFIDHTRRTPHSTSGTSKVHYCALWLSWDYARVRGLTGCKVRGEISSIVTDTEEDS